ncbi:MAG: hypothetical protein IPN12_08700 [Rhodocyclaceae bacterium]|nr:hypothetical protein [Rhodocyclaceae bacterium]MBK9310820.1 hypothetical protein [Rhodocyclaceae bacterium]
MRSTAIVLLVLALGACGSIAESPSARNLASWTLDPLSANWQVDEVPLGDDRFRLRLQMRRFHAGGAGEARVVFQQRARELARQNDYDDYQVVEYSERMDSAMFASQRRAEGVILLTRRGG